MHLYVWNYSFTYFYYDQVFLMTHVINNAKYISMNNVKNFPMMLTKACIDPYSVVNAISLPKVQITCKTKYHYKFIHHINPIGDIGE